MDKHNDDASDRFNLLEQRLGQFILKVEQVTIEMEIIRQQQLDLINLLNKKVK